MLIRVGFEISFQFPQPTAMIVLLYVHPASRPSIYTSEQLAIQPSVPVSEFIDAFGNRCGRMVVPAGSVTLRSDATVQNSGRLDPIVWNACQHEVQDLPDDALQFLLPSRYCEVDSELKDFAGQRFNSIQAGWPRVQAICDFVHQHVHFDYQQARANRTALETFREATGVCRDYTHLAITLCRCMNIPARYCTGYLGDIGVVQSPHPMDFCAWFEAYLGGTWYTFDPRNNAPRRGRVLIARGRDAVDAALTTTFGVHQLNSFRVWTYEVNQ